jgi:putative transcriptional regulator
LTRRWLLLGAAGIRAFSEELGMGKLLVSTRKSRDPYLAESVVLLIQLSPQEAIGLVVNRPTHSPAARLFPDLKPAHGEIYDGGPLAQGVRGLVRSRARPSDDAERLFGECYLLSDVKAIRVQVAAGASPRRFRLYEGRAGWTPGQLRNEVTAGLWRVVPADAALVFDPDPESLWARLIDR